MITALLIFFALVLEYIYDPISQMKDTKVINVTFERYKTFIKVYLDNKYYVYLLFPISIMIFYSLLTYILNNYLHGFFAFILDLIILVYCLKPSEFNRKVEEFKFSLDNQENNETSERFNYVLSNYNNKNWIQKDFISFSNGINVNKNNRHLFEESFLIYQGIIRLDLRLLYLYLQGDNHSHRSAALNLCPKAWRTHHRNAKDNVHRLL